MASFGKPPTDASALLLGVGSPFGYDRLGWACAERLASESGGWLETRLTSRPIDLLDYLNGVGTLLVIDACRGGALPGTVHHLTWPDSRILENTLASSHSFGLAEALQLADALGRLPNRVTLLAVDVGRDPDPEYGVEVDAPLVEQALPTLRRAILAEVEH